MNFQLSKQLIIWYVDISKLATFRTTIFLDGPEIQMFAIY